MTIALLGVARNPSKIEKDRPSNLGDDSLEAAIGRVVSGRRAQPYARSQSLTREAHGSIIDDELDPIWESIHLKLNGFSVEHDSDKLNFVVYVDWSAERGGELP